jgi:hypothetical protein
MKKICTALLLIIISTGVFGQTNLTVITPNGGENWVTGCPSAIQWMTTNTTTGPVRVELFKNGQFYMVINSQVPVGVTSITWVAPFNIVPGNDYKVKVSSLTSAVLFDFSDNYFTIAAGPVTNMITVIAPNGGETWITGCPTVIHWISTAAISPVKIELFKNNLPFMTICPQVPAGQNSFTWIPPNSIVPGNDFRVKVSSLINTTGFDFSDNNFSILRGTITVNAPNGGETWVKGTMHPILWSDNICDNVRIELWKGGAFNMVIATSVPSNGTFNWVVPNVATLLPGNDYKVKIVGLGISTSATNMVFDFSDGNFSIVGMPSTSPVTLIAPNGGENWIAGCPSVIHWITSVATAPPVKLELFKDNLFYLTINPQVPAGQGSFTWIPPFTIPPGGNYKVKVTLLSNIGGFDFSDGNFTISRGNISVVSPNGGEVWAKGTMHPILWTDNICQNVRIELWKGAQYHSLIAGSTPSTGMFTWMIPNVNTLVPGNNYKIKIISVSNITGSTALVFAYSDNFFTIAPGSSISLLAPGGTGSVYPNPFSDRLNVRLNGDSDQGYSIELMNLRGEIVLRELTGTMPGSGTVELSTSGIAAGNYILVVRQDNLLVSRQVVILER